MRHRDALRSLSMNPSNLLDAGACPRQQALDFLPGPVTGLAVKPAGEGAMRLAWPGLLRPLTSWRLFWGLGASGAAWWPCVEKQGDGGGASCSPVALSHKMAGPSAAWELPQSTTWCFIEPRDLFQISTGLLNKYWKEEGGEGRSKGFPQFYSVLNNTIWIIVTFCGLCVIKNNFLFILKIENEE